MLTEVYQVKRVTTAIVTICGIPQFMLRYEQKVKIFQINIVSIGTTECFAASIVGKLQQMFEVLTFGLSPHTTQDVLKRIQYGDTNTSLPENNRLL